MGIALIFIINTIFHFNGFLLLLLKERGGRRKGKHNALKAHGINRMVLINVYTSKAGRKNVAVTGFGPPPFSPALI